MPTTKTVEDVYDAAVARNKLNDGLQLVGTAEVIALVSRVQQEKFLKASQINPEFFGTNIEVTLDGSKKADLSTLSPAIAYLDLVVIANKGTSGYTNGDEVNVVAVRDFDAELAPRMFKQRYNLAPVGTDMNGVTSVGLYYSVLPDTMDITVTDMSTIDMDMPDEFIDSIVTELALYMAIKDNRSQDEIAVLQIEVQQADAIFSAAVGNFSRTTRRFNE
ncbi:MAG: hypothetical protein AMS18_00075 [Gemmatimonas sp. SG8_17]|nr:MAG: hypothetical protein AMS18_00075 [Gemmatimonas sp. SG8_17]